MKKHEEIYASSHLSLGIYIEKRRRKSVELVFHLFGE
jgi:hypothetical protein